MSAVQRQDEDAILRIPDTRLREVCTPVSADRFGTATLYADIERLNRSRHERSGIGIAAPQLGIMQCFIVIEIPAKDWLVFGPVEPVPVHALLNPEMTWSSEETVKAVETCLSIPGYQGFVPRPRRIGVTALTPEGERLEFEADGLYARCLQHEIDHLNGVLYPDRITLLKDIQKVEPLQPDDPVLSHNRHGLSLR